MWHVVTQVIHRVDFIPQTSQLAAFCVSGRVPLNLALKSPKWRCIAGKIIQRSSMGSFHSPRLITGGWMWAKTLAPTKMAWRMPRMSSLSCQECCPMSQLRWFSLDFVQERWPNVSECLWCSPSGACASAAPLQHYAWGFGEAPPWWLNLPFYAFLRFDCLTGIAKSMRTSCNITLGNW